MSGRKLYKTKLCLLYQRGRCWRQTCSFAHGDTEIRQFSASFDDRQDSGDADSRGNERRHSSQHNYSPEKTTETRDFVHGHSPHLSFKRRRKSKLIDGQSNFSGGARVSDGTEAQEKEAKMLSPDSRVFLKKQLKQVKFDIDFLEDQNSKLRAELEERTQEEDSLSSRIQDLEAQLSEEKELCMRITSNIKKFINTQDNCKRLQHELKRSQVRLDKLVEELDLDALQLYTNEENPSIKIVDDGETTANRIVNRDLKKRKDIASFANKKLHINIEAEERTRSVSLAKGNPFEGEISLSRRRVDHFTSNGRNEYEVVGIKRKDAERRQSNEDEGKPKRKRDASKVSGSDKVICIQNPKVLPSTSMAAHAMDDFEAELVEAIPALPEQQQEQEQEQVEEEETAFVTVGLPIPLPPLPLFSQNNYSQYEGEDEYVNVDELEEDLLEVDIV